ncbi:Aggrecan core protein Cartilage-specific proteoglycan core protein [Channa argus]|uniref:Aggrecan core protein Cartilage-specific proteoglycan core protein n=1 Tax=Channa argus TaxID=215402 RepID=A0A6G1PA75_CHAAH|nr:Aggrecan core protein Cartilage-specific proteoglycan core protein [Channa argus]
MDHSWNQRFSGLRLSPRLKLAIGVLLAAVTAAVDTSLKVLMTYSTGTKLVQSPCHWKAYCWIGLQREQSGSNVWKWSNGETSNFTNWNVNQPDDYDGDENCAIMGSFFWSDVPCGYSNAFLCYDEPILVQESKTWEEALEHCRNLSGSFTRNDHFYDLLHPGYRGFNLTSRKVILDAQTQEVWIGLRFLAGNWLWMDGNPLSEQLPACPAAGKFCGTMSKTGELHISNCLEKMNFICTRR